ncbi:MAG: hypothetical protein KJ623_02490 [Nanoarchaeota archaeon]|nr:hypothetical protein [Nanoarchaeota archaeon]
MKLCWIIILLLILPIAIAQEDSSDISDSYNWLYNRSITDLSTKDAALDLLALNNYDYEITDKLTNFLSTKKVGGCWPSSACTIIDTSFGLLVLDKTGQDTTETVLWLNSQEVAGGSIGGMWIIQIVSSVAGTCEITVEDGKAKSVPIVPNSAQNWIDVSTISSLSKVKSKSFYVDCSNVGDQAMHISLLYHIPSTGGYSETFLIDDEQVQQKDIVVNNACFPKSSGGSACDLDSTLYATWILNEIGEEVHTIPYLEERLNDITIDPARLSLLYLITKSQAYADLLKDKQKTSGSFSDSVYTTSLASLALIDQTESYINATNWLNLKRDKKNFSWNSKIVDTAIALIALYGSIDSTNIYTSTEETGEICDNLIDDNDDFLTDCGDPECYNNPSCTQCTDSDDCMINSDCVTKYGNGYVCDGCYCTLETISGCSYASDCADGEVCNYGICEPQQVTPEICDNDLDDDDNGFKDCEDSACEGTAECKKSSAWIYILLIILLSGGGFSYYYFNYIKKGKGFSDFKNDINLFFANLFKKKPKRKSFEEHIAMKESKPMPIQQRSQPFTQKPRKQEDLDNALEKSLEEARKLLGK